MTDLNLLRTLCAAPGPTGFEAPAQKVFTQRVSPLAEPQNDPLGNVWASILPEGSPHVVVTAHSDQIGLITTYIDEKGYLAFAGVGGVDPILLPGRALIIHTANGPLNGVVGRKPSHKMKAEERDKAPAFSEQWIDIGATSREEALDLVSVGDPITFPAAFVPLANGRYASPAFDNRAGVYVCARALEHYAASPSAARLTALATVHEETTALGARAIAVRWQPDVVIVVDVDFATDDPGGDPKKFGGELKLGAGPAILRGAPSNHALVELAREVAAEQDIAVQIKAVPGRSSTDADELMAAGRAAVLSLGIPLRNMHSPFEVIQPSDAEDAALLVAAIVRRLGE